MPKVVGFSTVPERIAAREAFGAVLPTVEIDDRPHLLDDLSMTGLSVVGANDSHAPGAHVLVRLQGRRGTAA